MHLYIQRSLFIHRYNYYYNLSLTMNHSYTCIFHLCHDYSTCTIIHADYTRMQNETKYTMRKYFMSVYYILYVYKMFIFIFHSTCLQMAIPILYLISTFAFIVFTWSQIFLKLIAMVSPHILPSRLRLLKKYVYDISIEILHVNPIKSIIFNSHCYTCIQKLQRMYPTVYPTYFVLSWILYQRNYLYTLYTLENMAQIRYYIYFGNIYTVGKISFTN